MTALDALVAEVKGQLRPHLDALDWVEEEVALAQARHPADVADLIFHAFPMLEPRARMGVEFVYRGYARELLDRVARGQDTRPATAAEVALACCEISLTVPLHNAPAGLYHRMWLAAFPDRPAFDGHARVAADYEALHATGIDDLEAVMRRKLAVHDRRMPDLVYCRGEHHGEPVTCRYAAPIEPPARTVPAPRLPDLEGVLF